MLNANLVLLVFSGRTHAYFFIFSFCLAIRFFYIFLGVHVSVLGGADSRLHAQGT